jgi:hypothetical protein
MLLNAKLSFRMIGQRSAEIYSFQLTSMQALRDSWTYIIGADGKFHDFIWFGWH